ncbi:MAG: YdcF family protein [Clostridia bacterium]|nr:YdcF family protein [Clostridia bacterium]
MIRFDTLDKKPKIVNVAIASAAAVVLLVITAFAAGDASFWVSNLILTVYFLTVICMLVRAFFLQLRYNPYSYNTIYYSGFSLLLLVLLIRHGSLAFRYIGQPSMAGMSSMLFFLQEFATHFIFITIPFILIFSIVLFVSNISLIRHEGRRLVNVLGIVLAFLLVGGLVLMIVIGNASGSETEVMIHDILAGTVNIIYLYFECMIIGVIIASAIVVHYEPEKDKDYIIILGCGIRKDGTPTPLLKGRVDRALRFREQQLKETGKDLCFVVSGGQGPNEVISEAECMKNYLISQGIPEERIITEDKSTTTADNMSFSKEKIAQAGGLNGKIAYATTNYHVFRGGLKARRVKMRAVGMGAKTKWYFWPNAAVREFVGLLTEHRLKQGLILGGLIVLHIVLTILAFKLRI